VIVPGSSNYDAFESYVELLNPADEPASDAIFRVALEEPLAGKPHTGVGNLRGWAVATDGIAKVTILIDGVYDLMRHMAARGGMLGALSLISRMPLTLGFHSAFNYSALQAGPHTITAVAYTLDGTTKESSAEFEVVRFESAFITGDDAVNLNNASCMVEADQISIVDATVDGAILDLLLKWRTAEQGFEIVEIR